MMSLKALGGGGGEKKKRGIACLEEDMLIPGTTQFLLSMETVSPLTDIWCDNLQVVPPPPEIESQYVKQVTKTFAFL